MRKRIRYFRDSSGQAHRVTDEVIDGADVPANEIAPYDDQAPAPPQDLHLVIRWPWESDRPVEPSRLTQALGVVLGLLVFIALVWIARGTIFSPF
jgi:hypothetical protein